MCVGEIALDYYKRDVADTKFGIWANKIRDELDKISFERV